MSEPTYRLTEYGTVNLSEESVECDFVVGSDTFFDKFEKFAGDLGRRDRRAIEKSIDNKSEEKIRDYESVRTFFAKVRDEILFEQTLATTSKESRKQGGGTESPGEEDLEKIPIEVRETIKAKFDYSFLSPELDESDSEEFRTDENEYTEEYDGGEEWEEESEDEEGYEDEDDESDEGLEEDDESVEEVEEEDEAQPEYEEGYGVLTRDGLLKVRNISDSSQIWDIHGKFDTEVPIVDLEKEFYIKQLAAGEEQEYQYQISGEEEPQIILQEFISTINDPEKLTYSLNINQDNEVLFKLSIENSEEIVAKNVRIAKTLFQGYQDVNVQNISSGNWEIEDNNLIWTIPEIAASAKEEIQFILTVRVDDKDQTFRSGEIIASYDLTKSQSKLAIEEFQALGDNMVSISEEQLDETPDIYRSSLYFENLSTYSAMLKGIELSEPHTNEQLVELPEEVIVQPGETWESEPWELNTDGELPQYQKEVDFTLLHSLSALTSTSISFEDIELAVAIFEAGVVYDIEAIPSHREVPFNATHTMSNGGAASFDYLSISHRIPQHFLPPEKEDIVFKKEGEIIEIDPDWISIKPADKDSSVEHEIFIEMDDLRETDIGMLDPTQEITVEYPITADHLTEDESFITNAEWRANTFPRGEPIVITEEGETPETIIEVLHERIRLMRGKSVHATADPDVYEVRLKLVNNSNHALQDYEVKDRVPSGFEAYDFNIDYEETSEMDGKTVFLWKLENIDVDETTEIIYMMRREEEDAKASEAQFSM